MRINEDTFTLQLRDGEICIRGGHLTSGYFGDEARTKELVDAAVSGGFGVEFALATLCRDED